MITCWTLHSSIMDIAATWSYQHLCSLLIFFLHRCCWPRMQWVSGSVFICDEATVRYVISLTDQIRTINVSTHCFNIGFLQQGRVYHVLCVTGHLINTVTVCVSSELAKMTCYSSFFLRRRLFLFLRKAAVESSVGLSALSIGVMGGLGRNQLVLWDYWSIRNILCVQFEGWQFDDEVFM